MEEKNRIEIIEKFTNGIEELGKSLDIELSDYIFVLETLKFNKLKIII